MEGKLSYTTAVLGHGVPEEELRIWVALYADGGTRSLRTTNNNNAYRELLRRKYENGLHQKRIGRMRKPRGCDAGAGLPEEGRGQEDEANRCGQGDRQDALDLPGSHQPT